MLRCVEFFLDTCRLHITFCFAQSLKLWYNGRKHLWEVCLEYKFYFSVFYDLINRRIHFYQISYCISKTYKFILTTRVKNRNSTRRAKMSWNGQGCDMHIFININKQETEINTSYTYEFLENSSYGCLTTTR